MVQVQKPGAAVPASPTRPFAWLTLLFIAVMLGMTAWALIKAKSWLAAPVAILFETGGNVSIRTLDHGGLWRLVSAKFQLGSSMAVFLFLPFFWVVGSTFERIYGRASLLLAFFSVTVFSSLCTLVVRSPYSVSVGAGGTTLGLAACLLVLALRGTSPALAEERRRFLIRAGIAFALYLVIIGPGLISMSLDSGSFGGGLACGFVLGFILVPLDAPGTGRRALFASLAAVVLAGAASVAAYFAIPEPPYLHSESVKVTNAAMVFQDQTNQLNDDFDALMKTALDEDKDPREFVPRIEAELLPKWTELAKTFDGLPTKPEIPDIAYLQPMRQYASNRVGFLKTTAEGWKTGDEAQFIAASKHKKKVDEAFLAIKKVSAAVDAKKAAKKAGQ